MHHLRVRVHGGECVPVSLLPTAKPSARRRDDHSDIIHVCGPKGDLQYQGQNLWRGLRFCLRRRGAGRFNLTVTAPADIDGLSLEALKALVVQLLSKVADQERLIAGLREENARLKGLNGRPRIKPSGMEDASEPKLPGKRGKHRRRGDTPGSFRHRIPGCLPRFALFGERGTSVKVARLTYDWLVRWLAA